MLHSRELFELKAAFLVKVASAARELDIDAVARWNDAAKQCEKLERQAREVEDGIARLKAYLENDDAREPHNKTKVKNISSKQEGKNARSQWVDDLKGEDIRLVGYGKRYQTVQGKDVGIAFANEKDDRWFLGLKDEPTDIAVLICKSKSDVYDFVLPIADMTQYWNALSRSNGQIKFNVRREGREFRLLIPGNAPLTITEYQSDYGPLRQNFR